MRSYASLLLVVLSLGACGPANDPSDLIKRGEAALGNEEHGAAATSFEAALEAMGEEGTHPRYLRAQLGLAEALASTNPAASRELIAALQLEQPGQVTLDDHLFLIERMAASKADGALDAAARTLKAAQVSFPEAKNELDPCAEFLIQAAMDRFINEDELILTGCTYYDHDSHE